MMLDDVIEALNKAAASSDQAVRNMALRYRELQSEFSQYEAFFAIYKMGIATNGAGHAPAARISKERLGLPKTPAAPRERSSKIDTFGTAMRSLLLEHGQPMRLNDIYTNYQQHYPEDQTTIETFRQRLVKRRGMIILVPKRGYWWAEAPLTEAAESV